MPPSADQRPGTGVLAALSVSGSVPPSRCGTASLRTSTGSKTASSPFEALTEVLIKRLRQKFSDVAQDVKSQELIANEVRNFMLKSGTVREQDLGQLEERIRNRLAGATPVRNDLTLRKRAVAQNDEWARIYEYGCQVGNEKERLKVSEQKQRSIQLKQILDDQIKEHEARKKAEEDEERAYYLAEQAAIKEHDGQEAAKKELQQRIMDRLKMDREAQLLDRRSRRQQALDKKAAEESDLAARLAYEAKVELQREEQQRLEAKDALKTYLKGNEENKRIREEKKLQEWAMDKQYMLQHAAVLDKQERERVEKLEKVKAVQARQAEEAKSRPEAKRWMDPAIIEKHLKAKEVADEAEERKRKEALLAVNRRLKADLDAQMVGRQALKEVVKLEEKGHGDFVKAKVIADEEKERLRVQAEADKKVKFRNELQAQMKDNAVRKVTLPMTEVEKKINIHLLSEIQQFNTLGRVPSPALRR